MEIVQFLTKCSVFQRAKLLDHNTINYRYLILPLGGSRRRLRRRGEGIRSRNTGDLTLPAGSYLASDPPALRGRVKACACELGYRLEFTRYTY
jgi:hypothetical protein